MKFNKKTNRYLLITAGTLILIVTYLCIEKLYNPKIELFPIYEQELINLQHEEASTTNPLVKKVFTELRNFERKNLIYFRYLNEKLKLVIGKKNLDDLQAEILAGFESEINFYRKLNKMINYISKTGNFYIPYSLSYNKMIEIISGSKKLVEDHFSDIISGKYPLLVNISENNKSYLIVGKHGSNWLATSEATFLKTVLLATITLLNYEFKSELFNSAGVQYFIQIFKLPKNLFFPVISEFGNKKLIFSDFTLENDFEIALPNNGYVFGGNRDVEGVVKTKGDFYDCTTWLKELLSIEVAFNTLDLLYLHRAKLRYGIVNPTWLGSDEHEALDCVLEPIEAKSIKDLKVGMIFVTRKFKFIDSLLKRKEQKPGKQGHVGIIVEINDKENTFLLASYNRHIPEIEGLNIRKYAFKEEFDKRNFYFNSKLK